MNIKDIPGAIYTKITKGSLAFRAYEKNRQIDYKIQHNIAYSIIHNI